MYIFFLSIDTEDKAEKKCPFLNKQLHEVTEVNNDQVQSDIINLATAAECATQGKLCTSKGRGFGRGVTWRQFSCDG